jgi:hypothetical protein
MADWRTFGAAPIPKEVPLWLFGAIVVLIVVLIVASGVIMLVGRWVKAPPDAATSSGGLLSEFRLMYEQGECSREEYEQIRNRLGKRLRQELELPPDAKERLRTPRKDPPAPPPTSPDDRITGEPPMERPTTPPPEPPPL